MRKVMLIRVVCKSDPNDDSMQKILSPLENEWREVTEQQYLDLCNFCGGYGSQFVLVENVRTENFDSVLQEATKKGDEYRKETERRRILNEKAVEAARRRREEKARKSAEETRKKELELLEKLQNKYSTPET